MGLNFEMTGNTTIKNENPLHNLNRQSSNNPIDNIPDNISEEEIKERVDRILDVINNIIYF
jgi:hypothetical protein